LHPKLKKFDSCLDEKEDAIAALKVVFNKYQQDNLLLPIYSTHSNSAASTSICSVTENPKTNSTKVNLLTQCFDSAIQTNVRTLDPYEEINEYLNYEYNQLNPENECEDGDIDVLLFWKEKQSMFPVLSTLAKQIYAIPASNTVVERLFSASKNTISDKRTNLGCDKINQLLFLQKNFTVLKQLSNKTQRKRTISISSTTTMSSEDSTCTMPKRSKLELDQESMEIDSEDIEFFSD